MAYICSVLIKYHHNPYMKHTSILAIVAITLTLVAALPEAVYTIHYVRSYRSDQIQ